MRFLSDVDADYIHSCTNLSIKVAERFSTDFTAILPCWRYETKTHPANTNPTRKAEASLFKTSPNLKEEKDALNCTVLLSHVA
jgi:hypothetical protein